MSVAEGYYIKEAAQVLQGRVVKTPRLTGVCVLDCELGIIKTPPLEEKTNKQTIAVEQRRDDIIFIISDIKRLCKFAGADSG